MSKEKSRETRTPTLQFRWARRKAKKPSSLKCPWWKPVWQMPTAYAGFRLEQKWNVSYTTPDCGTGQCVAWEEWAPVPHEGDEELFMIAAAPLPPELVPDAEEVETSQ